jgi:membrane-associated phospholipid phosphatase
MRTTANIISWLGIPLFMPIYALLLVFFVPAENAIVFSNSLFFFPIAYKTFVLTVFILLGVLAPGMSFLYLKLINVISSLEMEERNERNIPLLITLIYCLLLYFSFNYVMSLNIFLPKYIQVLPFSGVLVAATCIFVNYKMKISLHAAGAGIFTGYIFGYLLEQVRFEFWLIPLSLIVSGVIMSSRLYLKKHSPLEIYFGWAIAFFITFLTTYWYPF